MKKRIHVNQHIVRANKKHGRTDPALTVKTYKSNDKGNEVEILGSSKIVSRPTRPLSCGATVWVETSSTVVVYAPGRIKTVE
jgi:hypothetical protein